MSATGPTTASGKAIASRNAIRHGVLATIPVVPGLERQEDWDSHRAGVLESLAPQGHLEHVLAERVALQFWRLHRVARYEALALVTSQESAERDVTDRRSFQRQLHPPLSEQSGDPDALQEAKDAVGRLSHFTQLTDDASLTGPEASLITLSLEKITDPIDRTSVSVPFMADDVCMEDYNEWTGGKLRLFLTALAAAAARDPAALLVAAIENESTELAAAERAVGDRARSAADERSALTAAVERKQRERLVPSAVEMERIARYEAHLSRELYKAMHELEALQARRLGRPTPLARLDIDVSGLSENPKLRNELPGRSP